MRIQALYVFFRAVGTNTVIDNDDNPNFSSEEEESNYLFVYLGWTFKSVRLLSPDPGLRVGSVGRDVFYFGEGQSRSKGLAAF